jgi:hypothetical protein
MGIQGLSRSRGWAKKNTKDTLEKCMTEPSFATIAGAWLGEIV